ncbi:vWA domain-containing protein [Cellvibrio fibrivorans]|uniref:Ca-activated chloride channel family protein n=1 Tax=Cellvibrio fibrivorans TaxID=126350 RepID=A0ABU1V2C6_9GAMM|nr:VWA domain-containing protein [Cellvibrio fibrivorans]MDR7091608.1 Ca-activated chloride channel family protein [Cellvibrio fibrivorans]
MNRQDINDDDLQQLLQEQPPKPDADTKARHMAAAMAAFAAQQSAEKKSTVLQGFLERLRLTRDTNHHGDKSMNNTMNNNGFDNRPFWQKPALISGIAASSLAVLAGLTFMQNLMINSDQQELATRIAEQSLRKSVPLNVQEPANAIISEDKKILADMTIAEDAVEYQEMEAAVAVERKEQTKLAAQKMDMSVVQKMKSEAQPMALSAPAPMVEETIVTQPPQEFRNRFEDFKENTVIAASENPVSTFSIDVDTASYSFVRRMLNNGQLPEKDAVRSEEMINYFDYAYPLPKDRKTPFATYTSVMDSPWKAGNKLIHIGIQGYQLATSDIPQSNLVFLLDVSGSMDEPSKLPLVKQSMSLLLDTLKPDDTISIVVYAGAAGTVLEPTKAKEKNKILAALNNLQAGGSTAGAEGIALAYQLAEANFNAKGVNRIILATDGDFNVGQTGDEQLQDFVERKREKGIYLSVLGFGQGNYQDEMMQTLAQNGNGTAAYIDTLSEAQKVLVTEATSNLFPIAKDVKIQVEFNPNTVKEYRLIGYETRALNREDFSNDKVDAGEIGAGQRVTAIYEITPVGAESGLLENSRYQKENKPDIGKNGEYAFLRLRYKLPSETQSKLIETPIEKNVLLEAHAGYQQEVNFSIAVAGFAQLLRGSNYAGNFTYDKVIELAQANKGKDEFGYRTEFVQLVRKAKIAKEL